MGTVSMGSKGSAKPINFQRLVLEPINFWEIYLEASYFGQNNRSKLDIFLLVLKVPNPSIKNHGDATGKSYIIPLTLDIKYFKFLAKMNKTFYNYQLVKLNCN